MLDNNSPVERLNRIISTCQPKALFVEESLYKSLGEKNAQLNLTVINNDAEELEVKLGSFDASNLDLTKKITADNPAYIMFTSGSTGFPKGALMTHGNVLNMISWSISTFGFCPGEKLTNVNPLYFDNSVFDLYSALFSGACLVPFTRAEAGSPKLLMDKINELQCTSWFSVPSLLIYLDTMKMLTAENMKHIKRFIFGGEGYPKAKLKNLFSMYSDRADIYNVYGPTECTCICSNYKITLADFDDLKGLPPLGNMIENFLYIILNDDNVEVGADEVGELCLLGPNVGKGYYNDEKRTRESFVENPLNGKYSEVMYKTGDMVSYNSFDNKIYFIGRKDNQIKHMGYRIELDEIELALNRLDGLSQAAVIHGKINGISQIIATISPKNKTKTKLDERTIRDDLKEIIPDYMIPTKIFFEDILPKNANGKVDRKALEDIYFSESA
jgi:D-alanine--poly(phosphoribitol) ligase subunit 1